MNAVLMPFVLIFGGFMALILVILAIPYLGDTGMVDAQTSVNLTSTSTEMSSLLPWFAVLIGGGITLVAVNMALHKGF